MISHIHHINFLVTDLDQAIERYEALLGEHRFVRDELPQRSVLTARVKLASTWLILVQPIDEHSEPARHLQKHGEGFFLMSFDCGDLAAEQQRIQSHTDFAFPTPERTGLDGWRVRDLASEQFFGVQLQLTEEAANKK